MVRKRCGTNLVCGTFFWPEFRPELQRNALNQTYRKNLINGAYWTDLTDFITFYASYKIWKIMAYSRLAVRFNIQWTYLHVFDGFLSNMYNTYNSILVNLLWLHTKAVAFDTQKFLNCNYSHSNDHFSLFITCTCIMIWHTRCFVICSQLSLQAIFIRQVFSFLLALHRHYEQDSRPCTDTSLNDIRSLRFMYYSVNIR